AGVATQEERSEATRGKLLAVARKLFRIRGYARTFIEDIAARAGVTKGAFYHHFPDKKAIFLAVFHETEQALMEASAAGARGPDAWSQFRAGCRAFLEASMDAGVQRIILRDGPVVLGWEAWREIDARYSLGLIGGALRQALAAGREGARWRSAPWRVRRRHGRGRRRLSRRGPTPRCPTAGTRAPGGSCPP